MKKDVSPEMRVKFFVIPVFDPAVGEAELNRFLADHRILTIDRELVSEQTGTCWAVSVTYLERTAPAATGPKKASVDYKQELSPEDFQVYAGLRSLRKEVAEAGGVPPYAVFNNAQLAEMVRRRIRSKEELGKISGVGPARVEAHGERFLERLAELQAKSASGDGT